METSHDRFMDAFLEHDRVEGVGGDGMAAPGVGAIAAAGDDWRQLQQKTLSALILLFISSHPNIIVQSA
ncbi:unnamed protein product [Angiostrongylus costaricensis]|uniref:Uncharacterized protein n=1 Tax=Angiostrongylus costaricensis TaxID=334426 RepID=A0A0R3PP99_ANGCS|nr:unnamed protein product [Angiostrongylus costaricensis]